jgi:hypothetical protein
MTIYRTDLSKPQESLKSNIGQLHAKPLKSCYRCNEFRYDVVITKHPIYKHMCQACRTTIFSLVLTKR